MKLGIYGGTFDPIHNAHLAVAEEVKARLDLEEILFIPAGSPWLKVPVSPARHRLEMVRLAIAGKPHFKLSKIEVERSGHTYSIDTIAELKKQRPGDEFFFILGWDSFSQLTRWHKPDRLITLCWLVVVPRPGYAAPDLIEMEVLVPGLTRKVLLLDKPRIDISATEIRERVAQGLSINSLVPEAVAEYIKNQGLYSKEAKSSP